MFELPKLNLGFTPDPKLAFRSTTLSHLYSSSRPIPLSDNSYWSVYYLVFDFASDVPILISPSDIRKAIRLRPRNVANLVRALVHRLDVLIHSQDTRRILEDKERASEDPRPLTSQWRDLGKKVPSTLYQGAAGIVGVGSTPNTPKGPLREILNCVRVLTRILPFLMDRSPSNDSFTHPFEHPSVGEFESTKASDKEDWVRSLFWDNYHDQLDKDQDERVSPIIEGVVRPIAPQFVIDEDEEDETEGETETSHLNSGNHDPESAAGLPPTASPAVPAQPPLLATLLATIGELLFLPGVCVPVTGSTSHARYPIWTGGIGCSQPPSDHRQAHNSAKVEVIRLLLVVLSQPLYRPPQLSVGQPSQLIIDHQHALSSILRDSNPALAYFCTKTPKPLLLACLCSLLNTSLAPTKTSLLNSANAITNIASGLGKMAQEKMGFTSPTASLHSESPSTARRPSLTSSKSSSNLGGASAAGSSEGLASWSAELLCLLLLPDVPSQPTVSGSTKKPTVPLSTLDAPSVQPSQSHGEINGFRLYLSKLHRASDLDFILDHLLAIITKPMAVTSQILLPDAVASSASASSLLTNSNCGLSEAVIMLYVAMDCNPRLVTQLASSQKIIQLVIGLIFIILEQKDAPRPKMGLVRVCGILLQVLTAKELGAYINDKVELPVGIRARYAVPGTLADFLVVSICSVVFSTVQDVEEGPEERRFATIYPSLVISITNVSPLVKGLGNLASARLAQLCSVFSAPGFLLREEGSVRLLYYLLEVFNNVIQYQMSDNPNLIQALLRIHHRFDYLATFTLKDGLREIGQRKLGQPPPRRTSADSNRPTLDELGPGPDNGKGKGKMKESGEESDGQPVEEPPVPDTVPEPTAVSVGRNGFVATENWVSSWRDGLPLDAIQIMVTELKPKVSSSSSILNSASLLGLLPKPWSGPKTRSGTKGGVGWLAGLVWSLAYLRDSDAVGYWVGAGVELFGVRHLPRRASALERATRWRPFASSPKTAVPTS